MRNKLLSKTGRHGVTVMKLCLSSDVRDCVPRNLLIGLGLDINAQVRLDEKL